MVNLNFRGFIWTGWFILIPGIIMAQDNWYITINAGQHIQWNNSEETEVAADQYKRIFNPSGHPDFHPDYYSVLKKLLDEWHSHNTDSITAEISNDPYFWPDTTRRIDYTVFAFNKKYVNVLIYSRYGFSRWHNHLVVLKNLIIPRDPYIYKWLKLREYDRRYCSTFRKIKYGTSMHETERILGTEYIEYPGQSLQLRNIYYKKFNRSFCIQDEIVKTIEKGKPAWLNQK